MRFDRESKLRGIVEEILGPVTYFVALIIFVGGGLAVGCNRTLTQNQCLKAGYPNSEVTWTFDRYCIKRVDQTDVVVPFDKR